MHDLGQRGMERLKRGGRTVIVLSWAPPPRSRQLHQTPSATTLSTCCLFSRCTTSLAACYMIVSFLFCSPTPSQPATAFPTLWFCCPYRCLGRARADVGGGMYTSPSRLIRLDSVWGPGQSWFCSCVERSRLPLILLETCIMVHPVEHMYSTSVHTLAPRTILQQVWQSLALRAINGCIRLCCRIKSVSLVDCFRLL
jgi:hypothetical protein